MHDKKVSIIVPVYNVEQYLNKCIDSILNQTYRNIEVILINDGSIDNSREICDKYAKIDHRITVIHKENGGVSFARNVGLSLSSGDYIMFIDSDDWIEKDTLSILLEIQNENDYDVIMFGICRENKITEKTTYSSLESESFVGKDKLMSFFPKLIKRELMNSLCNKMYKASIIKKNKIKFNESINIAEDTLFNSEIFLKITSFYILDKCMYHYIIRDVESLTKRYNPHKYDMLIYVNNFLQSALTLHSFPKEALIAANDIRIKNIYSCFLDLFSNKKKLTFNEKRLYIKNILEKEVVKECKDEYESKDRLYKILKFILYTKNVNLIYFTAYTIFMIRR